MDNHEKNDFSLLDPEFMIKLYAQGAFPMADENGNIEWYFPEIRTIIPIENVNVPRSLKKFMSNIDFEYKIDCETMRVVKNCADRKETWISAELIEAYERLYKLGFLHSIEVYQKNKLVGGLYGITVKGAFFGESMFSSVSQASKCALVFLIEHLSRKEFVLLDIQFMTEHLKMFGAIEIPLEEYEELLNLSYYKNVLF